MLRKDVEWFAKIMQLQVGAELTLEICKHFLYLFTVCHFLNKYNMKYMYKIAINTNFDINYLLGELF